MGYWDYYLPPRHIKNSRHTTSRPQIILVRRHLFQMEVHDPKLMKLCETTKLNYVSGKKPPV